MHKDIDDLSFIDHEKERTLCLHVVKSQKNAVPAGIASLDLLSFFFHTRRSGSMCKHQYPVSRLSVGLEKWRTKKAAKQYKMKKQDIIIK